MTGPASTSATLVVVANSGLLWLADFFGVPIAPIQEIVWGGALSIFGAFAWQFLSAKKDREEAIAKGKTGVDVPRIDLRILGYAMISAPLASGLLIWLIHSAGGVVTSYSSIGLFMGVGAVAPQFVPMALSPLMRFLSGLTGGNKP